MERTNEMMITDKRIHTSKKKKKLKAEAEFQERIVPEVLHNNKSKSKRKWEGVAADDSTSSILIEKWKEEAPTETLRTVNNINTVKKEKKSKNKAAVQETIASEAVYNKSKSKRKWEGVAADDSTSSILIEKWKEEAPTETLRTDNNINSVRKGKKSKNKAAVQKTISSEAVYNKSKSKRKWEGVAADDSTSSILIEKWKEEAPTETLRTDNNINSVRKGKKSKNEATVQETIASEAVHNNKSKSKRKWESDTADDSTSSISFEERKTESTTETNLSDNNINTIRKKKNSKNEAIVQEAIHSKTVHNNKSKSERKRNGDSTEDNTNGILIGEREKEATTMLNIQAPIECETTDSIRQKLKRKQNDESTEDCTNRSPIENGMTETMNDTTQTIKSLSALVQVIFKINEPIESETTDNIRQKLKRKQNDESTEDSPNRISIENGMTVAINYKAQTNRNIGTLKKRKKSKIDADVEDAIKSETMENYESMSKKKRDHNPIQGQNDISLKKMLPLMMSDDTSDTDVERTDIENREYKPNGEIKETEERNTSEIYTSDEEDITDRDGDRDVKKYNNLCDWQRNGDVKQSSKLRDTIKHLNKEEKLPDETLLRLQNLVIQLRHTVLPQHQIENHAGTHVPTKQQKKVFEKYHQIKKGSFIHQEDVKIIDNWKAFCRLHDWDSRDVKPFLAFRHDGFYYIKTFEERLKFVQFLADGLPDRMLYSVYHRFKNLFSRHLQKRYSRKEDEQIIAHMENESSNDGTNVGKFAELAKILNRTRASVWRRYQLLKQKRI